MLYKLNEEKWKRLLERDAKLRDLAVKAGVENNFKRVQELNGCFAWNAGKGVIKSEEERKLAEYMFCMEDEDYDAFNEILQGRVQAARKAGVSVNEL